MFCLVTVAITALSKAWQGSQFLWLSTKLLPQFKLEITFEESNYWGKEELTSLQCASHFTCQELIKGKFNSKQKLDRFSAESKVISFSFDERFVVYKSSVRWRRECWRYVVKRNEKWFPSSTHRSLVHSPARFFNKISREIKHEELILNWI